jgi:hypothetical protein
MKCLEAWLDEGQSIESRERWRFALGHASYLLSYSVPGALYSRPRVIVLSQADAAALGIPHELLIAFVREDLAN